MQMNPNRKYPKRAKWPLRIVSALEALGGEAGLSAIYAEIQRQSSDTLEGNWRSTVRQNLQYHCQESRFFGYKDVLFAHKGRGIWGLRGDIADERKT